MSGSSGFWRVIVKVGQRRDQLHAQIRDEYLRLDEPRRCILRKWVDAVALAGEGPVAETGLSVDARVHLEVQGSQEMETVTVSPGILAKAMAAWDKGEDFIYNGP